jgi:hypothetical protein
MRSSIDALAGRESFDSERVDVSLHEISHRGVYQTMSFNERLTDELLRDNFYVEMTQTSTGPGVASMQVAFVGNFEKFGV